jgi:hypothetical protein
VASLCELLPSAGSILAVGAPSIARHLESLGRTVVLVDRQPFQGVKKHHAIEPGSDGVVIERCEAAIVDPPWYPEHLRRWAAWAARIVGPDKDILVSVWPLGMRPGDAEEIRDLDVAD